jgi:hypothetical protein
VSDNPSILYGLIFPVSMAGPGSQMSYLLNFDRLVSCIEDLFSPETLHTSRVGNGASGVVTRLQSLHISLLLQDLLDFLVYNLDSIVLLVLLRKTLRLCPVSQVSKITSRPLEKPYLQHKHTYKSDFAATHQVTSPKPPDQPDAQRDISHSPRS